VSITSTDHVPEQLRSPTNYNRDRLRTARLGTSTRVDFFECSDASAACAKKTGFLVAVRHGQTNRPRMTRTLVDGRPSTARRRSAPLGRGPPRATRARNVRHRSRSTAQRPTGVHGHVPETAMSPAPTSVTTSNGSDFRTSTHRRHRSKRQTGDLAKQCLLVLTASWEPRPSSPDTLRVRQVRQISVQRRGQTSANIAVATPRRTRRSLTTRRARPRVSTRPGRQPAPDESR